MGTNRLMETSFVLADSGFKDEVAREEAETASRPQIAVPVSHSLSGGIYARSGLIPAGSTFFGAVHKKDHINIVFGDVTVFTENGPVRLTGYHVLPTKAGSKRVAHTHADTAWTTVVRTDLTDIKAIEDELVEGSDKLQTRTGILEKETPCLSQP